VAGALALEVKVEIGTEASAVLQFDSPSPPLIQILLSSPHLFGMEQGWEAALGVSIVEEEERSAPPHCKVRTERLSVPTTRAAAADSVSP
jgi:hypothetical protein